MGSLALTSLVIGAAIESSDPISDRVARRQHQDRRPHAPLTHDSTHVESRPPRSYGSRKTNRGGPDMTTILVGTDTSASADLAVEDAARLRDRDRESPRR